MKYFVGALSMFALAGLVCVSFEVGKHHGQMITLDRVKAKQLSLPRDAEPYAEFGGKMSTDAGNNNLRGLLADPQFTKLSPLEQRAAMAEISGDNQFRELSDADTAQFIAELRQSSIVRATLLCGKKARVAYGKDYEDMDDYTLAFRYFALRVANEIRNDIRIEKVAHQRSTGSGGESGMRGKSSRSGLRPAKTARNDFGGAGSMMSR